MQIKNIIKKPIYIILIFFVFGLFSYFLFPKFNNQVIYNSTDSAPNISELTNENSNAIDISTIGAPEEIPVEKPIVVTHLDTPTELKAVYISAWVAGSAKFRDSVIKLIDDTEINAIVIDVKDSTGRVSFDMADPYLKSFGSIEKRIANIRALTDMLHKKNIYIIGRISVFQDPYMTKKMPEWAITKKVMVQFGRTVKAYPS